jgi:hypothetical protein
MQHTRGMIGCIRIMPPTHPTHEHVRLQEPGRWQARVAAVRSELTDMSSIAPIRTASRQPFVGSQAFWRVLTVGVQLGCATLVCHPRDGTAPLPSNERPLVPILGQWPLPTRVGRCRYLYCPPILRPSIVCRTYARIPVRCHSPQPRTDPGDNRGCGLPHLESRPGPVSRI